MTLLAALPSASVLLVVSRTITTNLKNGLAVSLGIVAGDLLFILLAILGLSLVAELMGGFFSILKILGGFYLIWFGISLFTTQSKKSDLPSPRKHHRHLLTSFFAGLLLTLGDIKAIIFYASLLPLFIDLTTASTVDLSVIIMITVCSVGGTKALYAIFATQAASYLSHENKATATRKIVGGAMIGTGCYLISKT
ncbi:MAG: LysE family translocator [Verrucomicrobiota bacterium]